MKRRAFFKALSGLAAVAVAPVVFAKQLHKTLSERWLTRHMQPETVEYFAVDNKIVRVYLDDKLQIHKTDYTSDHTGALQFTRPVEDGAKIRIEYKI